tara:strand:+ start:2518 stop:2904 length:387 start_codon:yes stop_codon:yes gene_type:complete
MFTNIIGFIKPLFKKDSKSMKTISKVRAPGQDEMPPTPDFENLVHHYPNEEENRKKHVVSESHDQLELSLDALRMIVEQSHEENARKKEAWLMISELEKQGYVSVPFDTDRPVISQLRAHLNNDRLNG